MRETRETIKLIEVNKDGYAVYEDSDPNDVYRYNENGKIIGTNRSTEYRSEKIPKRK